MVWKICEIWIFLWELPSRWAKFCEILSHSVKFGMYAVLNPEYPAFANSEDPDQLASEETNWSGSALFKLPFSI